MGAYLSEPKTEKESEDHEGSTYTIGASAMQGWRTNMEDAHILKTGFHNDPDSFLCAVLDGHGGCEVAKFVAEHFPDSVVSNEEFQRENYGEGLRQTFLKMDDFLFRPHYRKKMEKWRKSGSPGGPGSAQSLFAQIVKLAAGDDDLEVIGGSGLLGSPSKKDKDNDTMLQDKDCSEGGTASTENTSKATSALAATSGEAVSEEDENHVKRELTVVHDAESAKRLKKEVGNGEDDVANEIDPELIDYDPNDEAGSGCTAVVVFRKGNQLIVANAGDSRAVLCRGGTAIALSTDHKPELEEEAKRIHDANGWVENGRVNGNLNLSRAIGDLTYKKNRDITPEEQVITANPEIRTFDITAEDDFIVMGCDGIWEIKTNQEVCDFIKERIPACVAEKKPLSSICEQFMDTILSKNITETEGMGCDNMTMIIIDLRKKI